MTTYNTQNPVPSVDVRDLYDNAENLDNFSNAPGDFATDRLGVSRQTLQGIRNASQYQIIGAYAAGLEFTSYNQVFSDAGEFYAPTAGVTLPYTTTGSGAAEIATFRSVGDAVLRQDLADDTDPAKGVSLVARAAVATESILSLLGESQDSSKVISVKGYYAGAIIGGSDFYWDPAQLKSAHNGGTIISPTVPWDGLKASVDDFLAAVGETTPLGSGCFVSVQNKSLSPERFGAGGAGDDTASFIKLISVLPSGGTLELNAATYNLSGTLVFHKPLVIRGGSKENTKLLFDSSGTYPASPYNSCMIFLHSSSTVPGYSGDARRSRLQGFTAELSGATQSLNGFHFMAPVYLDSVDAFSFTLDGFLTKAGADTGVSGNANGCTFKDCTSQLNAGGGFVFNGNDANACVMLGSRAFYNGGYGFFDNSLLGNSYLGCEADLNDTGGYFAESTKPNRSVYFGCYCEPNQPVLWNIGGRCMRFGSLGDLQALESVAGGAFSSLPDSRAYLNHPLTFGGTDQIAFDQAGGACSQIGSEGIKYKASAAHFQVSFGADGANYTSVFTGSIPSIRFPSVAVAGNIKVGRPYFPQGWTVGGNGRAGVVGSGSAAPIAADGTFDRGAIWLNDLPSAGGFVGWVCVSAGTPGTWKTYGAISA